MIDDKLHLHKAKTVALSGLYDKANKLASFQSNFVSLEDVLKLVQLESENHKAAAYSKLIWTDMISGKLWTFLKITLITVLPSIFGILEILKMSFLPFLGL